MPLVRGGGWKLCSDCEEFEVAMCDECVYQGSVRGKPGQKGGASKNGGVVSTTNSNEEVVWEGGKGDLVAENRRLNARIKTLTAELAEARAIAGSLVATQHQDEQQTAGVVADGGLLAPQQVAVHGSKLNAASLVLGFLASDLFAAKSQWEAAAASLAAMPAGAQEGARNHAKKQVAKRKAEYEAVHASQTGTAKKLHGMQTEIGMLAVPTAKHGYKLYTDIFSEALGKEGGREAVIEMNRLLKELKKQLTKPDPASGFKPSSQPDDGKEVGELQAMGLLSINDLFVQVIEPMCRELDFSVNQLMCMFIKDEGRAFEKVFLKWRGLLLNVTDFGTCSFFTGVRFFLCTQDAWHSSRGCHWIPHACLLRFDTPA
jgi:hypothetical protein